MLKSLINKGLTVPHSCENRYILPKLNILVNAHEIQYCYNNI